MKYFEVVSTEAGATAGPAIPPARTPTISIEFPVGGKRAREVISRSNSKATGKYPSWKMNRNVHYESLHECNAFKLLDACPEVSYFGEQPCRIRYVMNGELRIHYPDVLVKIHATKELLEIKTPDDAAAEEVRERTEFMQRALPLLGFRYRVLTSDLLSQSPRLNNAETLLRFGRTPVSPVVREQIRQMFMASGSERWGTFQTGLIGTNYRSAVCRLLLEGALKIDFNQQLCQESLIQWVDHSIGGASWA
jgi:hypothetical protein